ncbi:greglin-like [Schistocerca serialis cubense]|uniref:greglin-like n=1 Tax=Schistocerca serialis cubense TaxID=2023355 RepID=UPI00214E3842|nr:greglin-like [Schistocerca serialis cubense]
MMRPVLLLLAAAAVASAYSAESDKLGSEEYRHTTTLMPCPRVCTKEYAPVCAEDKRGHLYKFDNACFMRMCGCRMRLRQVPLERCPSDAPGCPMREAHQQEPVVLDNDESPDESQSDSSADSMKAAHLRKNAVRREREFY